MKKFDARLISALRSLIGAWRLAPTNQSCPYFFDKTDLHILSTFERQGPIWPYIMFSGVFTHWPQVPGGPWVNEGGRSVVPMGLSVCLSVHPSPIFHSQAICLGDRGTDMTHGLKHELSSSLPPTVSGGTAGPNQYTEIHTHNTNTHRDTCDTWRAIRPHVAPSVYLKYTAALLLPTMHLSLRNYKESRTKQKHFRKHGLPKTKSGMCLFFNISNVAADAVFPPSLVTKFSTWNLKEETCFARCYEN